VKKLFKQPRLPEENTPSNDFSGFFDVEGSTASLAKDFIKGPPRRGPTGFYLLLILLANAKAGTDSHTRMFQKPAIEDAEPVIEHPPPPPPEPLPPPLEPPPPPPPLVVKLAEHVLLAVMVMVHVVLGHNQSNHLPILQRYSQHLA
jgi:hypothetical protein